LKKLNRRRHHQVENLPIQAVRRTGTIAANGRLCKTAVPRSFFATAPAFSDRFQN